MQQCSNGVCQIIPAANSTTCTTCNATTCQRCQCNNVGVCKAVNLPDGNAACQSAAPVTTCNYTMCSSGQCVWQSAATGILSLIFLADSLKTHACSLAQAPSATPTPMARSVHGSNVLTANAFSTIPKTAQPDAIPPRDSATHRYALTAIAQRYTPPPLYLSVLRISFISSGPFEFD